MNPPCRICGQPVAPKKKKNLLDVHRICLNDPYDKDLPRDFPKRRKFR